MIGISKLNSPSFIKKITSPNMAKKYVTGLIITNGAVRMIASEMDKSEKPSARHFAAGIAGLQEGFALAINFLATPLFAAAGLALGKNLIAKGAFKKVASELVSEKPVKFFDKVKKRLGVYEVDTLINKVNAENNKIESTVREYLGNLETKKEIFIKTGEDAYQAVESVKENILKALKGDKTVLVSDTLSKQAAESQGLITKTFKVIGDDETTHKNIIGSQKFGEAMGMAAALTVIAPYFSSKLVPVVLEKLGLAKQNQSKDIHA